MNSGDMDTLPNPPPPILLGPDSLESIGKGYPEDVNAAWPSSWLKKFDFYELPAPTSDTLGIWTGKIAELDEGSEKKWEKVGCFDHGVDWFGDGSLWFLDAPGVRRATCYSYRPNKAY